MLRSVALSAISDGTKGTVTTEQVAQFLQKLSDAGFKQGAGAGIGVDITANLEGMTIGALGYTGAAVHVAAFPKTEE
jgi:hypothetical protein